MPRFGTDTNSDKALADVEKLVRANLERTYAPPTLALALIGYAYSVLLNTFGEERGKAMLREAAEALTKSPIERRPRSS